MIVVLQSFSTLTILGAFYANQSYIASVLCERKAEPVATCNGKCYLAKEINKSIENSTDNNPSQSTTTMPEINIGSLGIVNCCALTLQSEHIQCINIIANNYIHKILQGVKGNVFTPPKIV
jgi:hypothetical protein